MRDWDKQAARETPVEGQCLWCKVPISDLAPEVSTVSVGQDGEELCTECLRDARSYNRYSYVQVRLSRAYSLEARRIINSKHEEAATALQNLDPDDEFLDIDPLSIHHGANPNNEL